MTDGVERFSGVLRRMSERVKGAADTLKDEYRKGLDGDDSPVQRIGPTAVDAIKGWLGRTDDIDEHDADTGGGSGPGTTGAADPTAATDRPADGTDDIADDAVDDAGTVADLLARADWRKVSAAARDSQAAQRMRDLAAQVDWAAAKPVAARVASALIAAAAAGELGGLQGSTGRYVARTIANEMGLADRVAQRVTQSRIKQSTALARYIDTTATEVPTRSFADNLAALERLGDEPA